MGQTYVYNLGSFDDTEKGVIDIECGLFFDGTGNNHTNTEIRKKIEKIDEYADQSKPENRATLREKAIYYSTLLDDSYKNDFSNVARLWRGCKKDYKIYIEGIGTNDKGWDNLYPGMAKGEGITGIRGKVRKGCEKLADKIKKKIGNKDINKIQNIDVTIDVFGFSRGAAAARNFLYEIGNNKKDKDRKIISRTEYESYGAGLSYSARAKKVYYDKDGFQVNPAYLDNEKMPKMGYLGYYLLQHKLTKVELNKITLKIRFVGLYDTVASYGWEHKDDVEELQLNDFGKPKKVVHFTAMDEHRENFALTKIPKGDKFIEKEFPGVHSDIGGSYETGVEVVDEIENSNYNTNLEAERRKIINEYWYTEKQIEINGWGFRKLTGTRFLKKEYSYIPLHLMEELFIKNITSKDSVISKRSVTQYPIEGDNILVQAKKYLTAYIEGNKKEWRFIPDKIEKIDFYNTSPKTKEEKWYQENVTVKRDKTYVAINSSIIRIQPEQEDQKILRILRNKYLHWSANRDWLGMDPRKVNGERKRKEF